MRGKANGMNTPESSAVSHGQVKNRLTEVAAWIDERHIPFSVTSIGMIVMLLWAGAYKMTAAGSESITLHEGAAPPGHNRAGYYTIDLNKPLGAFCSIGE
jgi:hypothetical protein